MDVGTYGSRLSVYLHGDYYPALGNNGKTRGAFHTHINPLNYETDLVETKMCVRGLV
jgi:hypothetical protein